jgi:hypothetical protein
MFILNQVFEMKEEVMAPQARMFCCVVSCLSVLLAIRNMLHSLTFLMNAT